jgi:hypothetical protein
MPGITPSVGEYMLAGSSGIALAAMQALLSGN